MKTFLAVVIFLAIIWGISGKLFLLASMFFGYCFISNWLDGDYR